MNTYLEVEAYTRPSKISSQSNFHSSMKKKKATLGDLVLGEYYEDLSVVICNLGCIISLVLPQIVKNMFVCFLFCNNT